MYNLFETDEYIKSINKLQKRDKALVHSKLRDYVYPQIKSEPHFGINIKKLKGYTPNTWRYRIGNFRVFYTIDEDDRLVLLLIVENRDKAYRKN
ncbi:type II toxin-antitoxin system RelE/ParE family toxin [Paraglaciecola aquimarina]|uniref:Type II toxin-antitoxin system RelE/ParE family toxin n=1 Tax=Paraglaciecola algarum TaxID=3050085 RepID=A0ABS9D837_9ALTE|nr:type II toxin-antitoxin system RelE/ParE family toxin [Paraglaciecola sp. G1-23]MCF2948188.1 type II toxin-antitoxin system RelE/ParE family toxin [Paraglaciecola sp. G1-23]